MALRKSFYSTLFGTESVESSRIECLSKSLKRACETGNLHLANQGLVGFPSKLYCLAETFKLMEILNENSGWWKIAEIETVDLSYNQDLKELIDSEDMGLGGNWDQLKIFSCVHTSLIKLPINLFKLEKLHTLRIDSNALTQLPPHGIRNCSLKNIFVANNQLKSLPSSLFCNEDGESGSICSSLSQLHVQGNSITQISAEIGRLQYLRILNLSSNQLKTIPKQLSELKKLEDLDISGNMIECLSISVQLPALLNLNLGNNKIKNLNNTKFNLPVCKNLNLSHNMLKSLILTDILEETTKLEILTLTKNSLTDIFVDPNKVTKTCGGLRVLDLSFNDLKRIPSGIASMPTLQKFYIDGNGIRTIKSSLLARENTGELLAYLKRRDIEPPPQHLQHNLSTRGASVLESR